MSKSGSDVETGARVTRLRTRLQSAEREMSPNVTPAKSTRKTQLNIIAEKDSTDESTNIDRPATPARVRTRRSSVLLEEAAVTLTPSSPARRVTRLNSGNNDNVPIAAAPVTRRRGSRVMTPTNEESITPLNDSTITTKLSKSVLHSIVKEEEEDEQNDDDGAAAAAAATNVEVNSEYSNTIKRILNRSNSPVVMLKRLPPSPTGELLDIKSLTSASDGYASDLSNTEPNQSANKRQTTFVDVTPNKDENKILYPKTPFPNSAKSPHVNKSLNKSIPAAATTTTTPKSKTTIKREDKENHLNESNSMIEKTTQNVDTETSSDNELLNVSLELDKSDPIPLETSIKNKALSNKEKNDNSLSTDTNDSLNNSNVTQKLNESIQLNDSKDGNDKSMDTSVSYCSGEESHHMDGDNIKNNSIELNKSKIQSNHEDADDGKLNVKEVPIKMNESSGKQKDNSSNKIELNSFECVPPSDDSDIFDDSMEQPNIVNTSANKKTNIVKPLSPHVESIKITSPSGTSSSNLVANQLSYLQTSTPIQTANVQLKQNSSFDKGAQIDTVEKSQKTPTKSNDKSVENVTETSLKSDSNKNQSKSPKVKTNTNTLSTSWSCAVSRSAKDSKYIDGFGITKETNSNRLNQTAPIKLGSPKVSTKNVSKNDIKPSDYDDDDQEEEEEENEESVEKNEFIDDEAEEASNDESMDEEERQYLKDNEIPCDGISIGSEDTDEQVDEEESINSFIVSDSSNDDDDAQPIDGSSGDVLSDGQANDTPSNASTEDISPKTSKRRSFDQQPAASPAKPVNTTLENVSHGQSAETSVLNISKSNSVYKLMSPQKDPKSSPSLNKTKDKNVSNAQPEESETIVDNLDLPNVREKPSLEDIMAKCNSFLNNQEDEKQKLKTLYKQVDEEKMQRLKNKKELKLLARSKREANLAAIEKQEEEKRQRKLEKKKRLQTVEVTDEQKKMAIEQALKFSQQIKERGDVDLGNIIGTKDESITGKNNNNNKETIMQKRKEKHELKLKKHSTTTITTTTDEDIENEQLKHLERPKKRLKLLETYSNAGNEKAPSKLSTQSKPQLKRSAKGSSSQPDDADDIPVKPKQLKIHSTTSKDSKKIKRKQIEIVEPKTLLDKPQWTSSGQFTVSKLSKSSLINKQQQQSINVISTVSTDFMVTPLRVPKKADIGTSAKEFKERALNSAHIRRVPSKVLLQSQQKQKAKKY